MSTPASRRQRRLRVWDLPTRAFHWLLVLAVATAFISAEEDSAIGDWHQLSGWVAGVLIVFRLVWGLTGGEHARFVDFLRPSRIAGHLRGMFRRSGEVELGHNPLGGLAVLALLGLVALSVATGVLTLRGADEDAHEAIANGLLALVGLHVAAVVVMSLVARENLVRAMVDGRKPAARHPGAKDARPAPALALPLALLVAGVAGWGATRIDPQAFTPHPRAEAHEARQGGEDVRPDDDEG